MKFYNREQELKELEKYLNISNKSGIMLAIYGRRRVGKTELVKEAFKNSKMFYFFAKKLSKEQVLAEFVEEMEKYLKITLGKFDDWSKPLEILFEHAKREHVILVIDEFQNFNDIDKGVFSVFQALWDKHAKTSKILIVLVGSYVGMMKRIFFDSKEPLYGRVYNKYDIKPLKFNVAAEILRDLKYTNKEDIIELYSIFGGIPRYYIIMETESLHGRKTMEIVDSLLLKNDSILRNEVMDILIQEFGTNRSLYYSIIQAIALGKCTPSEIAEAGAIEKTSISKYLEELESEYEIIERKVPVTEEQPLKSKKGRYFLKDNFFRFWFRFIYRNMSYYEVGNYKYVREKIVEQIPAFIGRSFEGVCTQKLIELNNSNKLPCVFTKIGPWWDRKGNEIDIVAIGKECMLFAGCKWENKKTGFAEFNKLKEHSDILDAKWKKYYALFSKRGFEAEFVKFAKENGILLFGADDII
ncbi:MAG: DUF234 domain-containing protein [Nanoarchaeota archaeon]